MLLDDVCRALDARPVEGDALTDAAELILSLGSDPREREAVEAQLSDRLRAIVDEDPTADLAGTAVWVAGKLRSLNLDGWFTELARRFVDDPARGFLVHQLVVALDNLHGLPFLELGIHGIGVPDSTPTRRLLRWYLATRHHPADPRTPPWPRITALAALIIAGDLDAVESAQTIAPSEALPCNQIALAEALWTATGDAGYVVACRRALADLPYRQASPIVEPHKDDKQRPVPHAWRPVLSSIVKAFAEDDFELARGLPSVVRPSTSDASDMRRYPLDYGAALAALPDETWESSVTMWLGACWDVLVDLWIDSGRSDMVLQLRVFESGDGYRFEPQMVYVP